MSIHGFQHIANIGPGLKIAKSQIDIIKKSGLINDIEQLHLGIVGPPIGIELSHPKIVIDYHEPDIKKYEFPTLKLLWDICLDKNISKVFYFHVKGASKIGLDSRGLRYWRELHKWRREMEYTILWNYKSCISNLKDYDTFGCRWMKKRADGQGPPSHYSGNFWWANANYIRTLPDPSKSNLQYRYDAEFWIGKNPEIRPGNVRQLPRMFLDGLKVRDSDFVAFIKSKELTYDKLYV